VGMGSQRDDAGRGEAGATDGGRPTVRSDSHEGLEVSGGQRGIREDGVTTEPGTKLGGKHMGIPPGASHGDGGSEGEIRSGQGQDG